MRYSINKRPSSNRIIESKNAFFSPKVGQLSDNYRAIDDKIIGGANFASDSFAVRKSGLKNEKQAENQTAKGLFPCPCCGFLTYPCPRDEAIAYICPVCLWENDLFTKSDDEKSDENHGLSLLDARENFLSFGACTAETVRFARNPHDSEIPSAENADDKSAKQ